MKETRIIIFIIVLLLAIVVSTQIVDLITPPIVGLWHQDGIASWIEFNADGTFEGSSYGSGTYKIDGTKITLYLDGCIKEICVIVFHYEKSDDNIFGYYRINNSYTNKWYTSPKVLVGSGIGLVAIGIYLYKENKEPSQ